MECSHVQLMGCWFTIHICKFGRTMSYGNDLSIWVKSRVQKFQIGEVKKFFEFQFWRVVMPEAVPVPHVDITQWLTFHLSKGQFMPIQHTPICNYRQTKASGALLPREFPERRSVSLPELSLPSMKRASQLLDRPRLVELNRAVSCMIGNTAWMIDHLIEAVTWPTGKCRGLASANWWNAQMNSTTLLPEWLMVLVREALRWLDIWNILWTMKEGHGMDLCQMKGWREVEGRTARGNNAGITLAARWKALRQEQGPVESGANVPATHHRSIKWGCIQGFGVTWVIVPAPEPETLQVPMITL